MSYCVKINLRGSLVASPVEAPLLRLLRYVSQLFRQHLNLIHTCQAQASENRSAYALVTLSGAVKPSSRREGNYSIGPTQPSLVTHIAVYCPF